MDTDNDERAQRTARAIARGWAAANVGRFSVAENQAREALAIDPESVAARLLLIDSLRLQQRVEEALPLVEEALARAPDEPLVHAFACEIHCANRAHDRALQAAHAHARLAPHTATTQLLYAKVMYAAEHWRAAIDHAQRALAIEPNNVVALERLGLAAIHVDARQAEVAFLRRLAIRPNCSMTLNNLGVALERQGRLWEAAKVFESAVRLDPSNKLARNNTRSTLKRWTSPAAALGVGGTLLAAKSVLPWLVPGLLSWLARQSLTTVVIVVVLAPASFGAAWGVRSLSRRALERRRRSELAQTDPALYAMFCNLERDAEREANPPRAS